MNQSISEILFALNKTGGIPLSISTTTTTTNWTQLLISLVVGSFFLIFVLYGSSKKFIGNIFTLSYLYKIKKMSGRHVLLIKHTENGFMSRSMIDSDTLIKITKALQKFKGEPFDIILHTPGGTIFSAMLISRILKDYTSEIRSIIPMYAMSGGTLIALSTSEIFMGDTACLGPTDPQLGDFFKSGSAKSWNKIVKLKGKKANDSTISFAHMGEQYTKSIKKHLDQIIDFNMGKEDKKRFINFLSSGDVEHAFNLTREELAIMGLKTRLLPDVAVKTLFKIISNEYSEGVTYI